MVAIVDSFLNAMTPYLGVIFDTIGLFIQLGLILGGVGYGLYLFLFSIKLNIREYSKGGRVISSTSRAMKVRDKKTGAPKLRLFGMFGFAGETINEPPAECLVAHKSPITNKMYDLIRKDGIYYPIQNIVLGIKHKVTQDVEKGSLE